jgi:hypothetical protein
LTLATTLAAAAASAGPALAAPVTENTEDRTLQVAAFVDGFFAYNDNQPADHLNFFPGVGTSAKRDNEFAINLAQADLWLAPEPVGFHLALGFGTATDVVHAAELPSVPAHPDTWRNVVQASIQYQTKIGRGLLLEGGIYPSHIGFEAFATKDNWNYTRSWLGELSPYYQTGVKAAYPLSERWSTQVHLLNGWQVINDNNRGKSLGWQFAYAADRLTWSLNGIVGPELTDNDRDLRALVDTVLVYEATSALSLGASLDAGRQEQPAGASSRWHGIGLYGRYAPQDSRMAFALRTEYYDDDDGAISGTAQTLKELTATFEHRPVDRLIVKLEGRYDRSSAPVFAGDERDAGGDAIRDQDEQLLFLVGVVAHF